MQSKTNDREAAPGTPDYETRLVDAMVAASAERLTAPVGTPISLRELLSPEAGGRPRGSGHGHDRRLPAMAQMSKMNRLLAVVFAKTLPVACVRFVRMRGGCSYFKPTHASLDRLSRTLAGMCPAPSVTKTDTGVIYHVPMPAPFGGPRSLNPAIAEPASVSA